MSDLLHELIFESAARNPVAPALARDKSSFNYAQLADSIRTVAGGLIELGLGRGERVGVYLEKRLETVATFFGTSAAGGVFVPINSLLKPEQVAYIMNDCNVRILVTSPERLQGLTQTLAACRDLHSIVVVNGQDEKPELKGVRVVSWQDVCGNPSPRAAHRVIDGDVAAILYTSGSTGKPKGVVLSHRNMVAGAKSVAQYLENRPGDRILSVLPLSFDAGFSQLTTAFHAGASVVLMNYLLPRDVIQAVERERITGLTAVPPLWIQLAQMKWPASVTDHLRYIANTGGKMPKATLDSLRAALPRTLPFLMYGLTESAKRSRTPRCSWCAKTARPARRASRANSCIAAHWCRSATGTTQRKPPSGSSRRPIRQKGW